MIPRNRAGNLVIAPCSALGEIDRTTRGLWRIAPGDQHEVLDHPNNFVVGVTIDRGHMQFNGAVGPVATGG